MDPYFRRKGIFTARTNNSHDARSVAVLKDGIVVGHVPREIPKTVWYLLNRGGS
uniref:HIRAN domain-containing protein n=1 Tax=Amphimedon queenslandica TaxID=400682 RepID=A0A1X7VS29_AMPQE